MTINIWQIVIDFSHDYMSSLSRVAQPLSVCTAFHMLHSLSPATHPFTVCTAFHRLRSHSQVAEPFTGYMRPFTGYAAFHSYVSRRFHYTDVVLGKTSSCHVFLRSSVLPSFLRSFVLTSTNMADELECQEPKIKHHERRFYNYNNCLQYSNLANLEGSFLQAVFALVIYWHFVLFGHLLLFWHFLLIWHSWHFGTRPVLALHPVFGHFLLHFLLAFWALCSVLALRAILALPLVLALHAILQQLAQPSCYFGTSFCFGTKKCTLIVSLIEINYTLLS